MRKTFLALLLLPTLAFGQAKAQFTEKKSAPAVEQPAGTIDRVSKRTAISRTFEADSIGSGKMQTVVGLTQLNYQDSTGAWKKIDLTAKVPKTAGYAKRVDVGQSMFEYDSTGRVRYQKGKAWFALVPAFKDVGIEFNFTTNGLKANYYLDDKSPSRLAWGLKESTPGLAERKIEPFTAWDDSGKAVPLATTFKADSLIVLVDRSGAIGMVTLDPTINDSLVAATTYASMWASVGADWRGTERNAAAATSVILWSAGAPSNVFLRQYNTNGRSAYTFPLAGLSGAITISAMTFTLPNVTVDQYTPVKAILVKGTFDGTPGTDWYNAFVGWAASGAYATVPYSDTLGIKTDSAITVSFTAAAMDSVEALVAAGDSLKLVMLTREDASEDSASQPAAQEAIWKGDGAEPYIQITYTEAASAYSHVTTGANDTVKVVALAVSAALEASYDSSGSGLDSVGFVLHLKGNTADTLTTIADSAGASWTIADSIFYLSTAAADTLLKDTLYVVTAFAETGATRTYSTVNDTISTYITDGTVTTEADSIVFVAIQLTGSTAFSFTPATTPITVRGIEYFYVGASTANTDSILDTGGPWAAGLFDVIQDSLLADTTIVYRALSTDVTGSYVGTWDTLSTSGTGQELGGEPIEVMGIRGTRVVNW